MTPIPCATAYRAGLARRRPSPRSVTGRERPRRLDHPRGRRPPGAPRPPRRPRCETPAPPSRQPVRRASTLGRQACEEPPRGLPQRLRSRSGRRCVRGHAPASHRGRNEARAPPPAPDGPRDPGSEPRPRSPRPRRGRWPRPPARAPRVRGRPRFPARAGSSAQSRSRARGCLPGIDGHSPYPDRAGRPRR